MGSHGLIQNKTQLFRSFQPWGPPGIRISQGGGHIVYVRYKRVITLVILCYFAGCYSSILHGWNIDLSRDPATTGTAWHFFAQRVHNLGELLMWWCQEPAINTMCNEHPTDPHISNMPTAPRQRILQTLLKHVETMRDVLGSLWNSNHSPQKTTQGEAPTTIYPSRLRFPGFMLYISQGGCSLLRVPSEQAVNKNHQNPTPLKSFEQKNQKDWKTQISIGLLESLIHVT